MFASIGVRATLLQVVLSFRGCSQGWFRREFIKMNILLIFASTSNRIQLATLGHNSHCRFSFDGMCSENSFSPISQENSIAHIVRKELTWRNICDIFYPIINAINKTIYSPIHVAGWLTGWAIDLLMKAITPPDDTLPLFMN